MTVPPAVSIAVHALLIGAVAYIGMQISAAAPEEDRLPIAELALPAAPEMPKLADEPAPSPSTPQEHRTNKQALNQASPPSSIASLDDAAANLERFKLSAPTMDPASLASLETSHAQMGKPRSASPPTVSFAGVQTRAARKVVYVVDGSGATANSFAYLQTQLLRSIDRLSPTQRFQVVLFRSIDDQEYVLAPINNRRLARATPQNKQRVTDWLSTISSRGRSNPVVGLHEALKLKPDLILLITRSIQRTEMGWAQGQQQILAELNRLNPPSATTGKRATAIKAIQLLDEDPTGIMNAIGTLHGDGSDDYRVVTYDDLIAPDQDQDLSTRSIGATNEQRIVAAGELMGTLANSGTGLSVLYSYADPLQGRETLRLAKQIRSLVRPLVTRDGRAAILDAQAVLMLSIVSPGSVNNDELQTIIDTLDPVLYSEPNTDAQRVLTVAGAFDRLGKPGEAQRRVIELLEVADDFGLDDSTRAQCAIALISMGGQDLLDERWGTMTTRFPFVTPGGSIDAVWGLILRETMTKSLLASNAPNPWEPMIEMRSAARTNQAMGNYIDTRITLILDSTPASTSNTDLPSAVLLAAANTMSHSMDRRQGAMDLLGIIAERDDEPGQAADALWQIGVLGRVLNTPDARARSAIALTTLAKQYPDHPRARDAIAGAIHATAAHEEALARDRLSLGVRLFPDHPQIDLWRLALAGLLTDFAVLDMLDPITPDTREGVLAGELYQKTVVSMLERYDEPQVQRGLGIRMRNAAKRFDIPGAQMWTKRAAIQEIELDPESAIGSIDQLIAEAKDKNRPTDELELMRAQTLFSLGQSRTGFEALRDLSTRIDATGNHTSTYWQAWALMLETIAEQGSAAEKTDALRHIARLELIDSNLGGTPWAQRIMAVRQTLHSSP